MCPCLLRLWDEIIALCLICIKQVLNHISKDLILIPIVLKYRKPDFLKLFNMYETHSETPNHICVGMWIIASMDKQFQGMNASLMTHPQPKRRDAGFQMLSWAILSPTNRKMYGLRVIFSGT